jgi:transposase
VQGVQDIIAACGACLRYLPAYSPDLNPIELAFAKLKADLRRAAARDWQSLLQATATALGTFTPAHCSNFLVCDRLNRKCSRPGRRHSGF